MPAAQLAQFACGLTGTHEGVQAVARALAAAATPATPDTEDEPGRQRVEAAGLACRAAIRE
eukprot:4880921-Pleurochrysis_carterae.AAC.1